MLVELPPFRAVEARFIWEGCNAFQIRATCRATLYVSSYVLKHCLRKIIAMSVVPLIHLKKGVHAHIDSIVVNPVFGDLDAVVSQRLLDLGFSNGMPLMVIAVGMLGKGPFAVRLGNQSQFALRAPEAAKIMCRPVTESFE